MSLVDATKEQITSVLLSAKDKVCKHWGQALAPHSAGWHEHEALGQCHAGVKYLDSSNQSKKVRSRKSRPWIWCKFSASTLQRSYYLHSCALLNVQAIAQPLQHDCLCDNAPHLTQHEDIDLLHGSTKVALCMTFCNLLLSPAFSMSAESWSFATQQQIRRYLVLSNIEVLYLDHATCATISISQQTALVQQRGSLTLCRHCAEPVETRQCYDMHATPLT